MFIYGIHTVQTALEKNPQRIGEILVGEHRRDHRIQKIIQLAESSHILLNFVSKERLRALIGEANHQNVIARLSEQKAIQEKDLDSFLASLKSPAFLLILDGVQDPHNLGACLRSADAAGVQAVIVPKDQAAGLTSVVSKVASGAAEVIPLIQVNNLARALDKIQGKGIWIVGADESAEKTIFEMDFSVSTAIVLGAEGKGLRRLTKDYCDFLVKIPMQGTVASLNVSVATGICLFEVVRQRMNLKKSSS